MAPRIVRLFQYGSNMDPERLNGPKRLNGAAHAPVVVRIGGWGVRFDLHSVDNECGVTDIVPKRAEHVVGVLYEVPYRLVVAPRGQRSKMDEIEGAGLGKKSNYKRIKILVRRKRAAIKALTYVGTATGRKRFFQKPPAERRVSRKYFNHLLAGARKFKFPPGYVAYLRRKAGELKE